MTTDDFVGIATAALERGMDDGARRRAPGAIAAVCERGEVRAVLTHGNANRGGRRTTRDTVFRIASMSKSFLGAAVLALRDDGVLDLHAPITIYLPDVVMHHDGTPVTVTGAMLLSNRAGLGEDNAWADRNLGASRSELMAMLADGIRLTAAPGTTYQYSNLGISLLGRAIESVTGRAVEEVVRERILDPLGLGSTAYVADGYPTPLLAQGERTFDDGETFISEPFVGSGALACIGSMFSTVDDIAAWMWFLGSALSDDPVRPEVLAPRSRRELQQMHTPIPLHADRFGDRDLLAAGYGYGVVIEEDRRFGRVIQHAGGLPGFSSHMRWHAATGLGAVAFGNSDDFGAGVIASAVLLDVLEGVQAPSAVVRPWTATVDAARHVDAALREGRSFADVSGFADNVLRDIPAEIRDFRLAAVLAEIGGLRTEQPTFSDRVVTAGTEADMRWRIEGESADLLVDLRMIGLPIPQIQELSIAAATRGRRSDTDEPSRPSDHHRVVLPDARGEAVHATGR